MKLSEEAILAQEKIDIDKWERRGVKFTRRDGELLRDDNGCYHVRARMMTWMGCGLAVGYMLYDAQGRRQKEPWQVHYGEHVSWFGDDEVEVASFLEYCFRTKGAFGGTPWLFVWLLALSCVWLSMQYWWLGVAEMALFIAFTYCNYKFWFR